jgi:sialic acid synthase SpsE
MKFKIIAEVGINHFGKIKLLEKYIESFKNKKIDGISIQILNKKKTVKKFRNYCLKKNEIKKFIKIAKKNFKFVGVTIHSWDDFKFLSNLRLDFIKILSSSFGDFNYFKKVKSTKVKKVFISSGGKTLKEISSFLNIVNQENLTLIHTFFKTNNFEESLKKIEIMKKNFKIPVAYGNHFNKVDQIHKVCKYKPSEIFFYIKMNKMLNYPDDKHAVPLKKIDIILKKILNDKI